MKKLLAIFAHPDDESFGPAAGILAKYAAEGVEVYYVCATRGEAGEVSAEALAGYPGIAELRTDEMHRAAKAMNFKGVTFLGYRDSGMNPDPQRDPKCLVAAPLDEVARRLAFLVHRLRPDAIITHDQFGWYGHPDHIKVYDAVVRMYKLVYGIEVGSSDAALKSSAPTLLISTFPKFPVKLSALFLRLTGRDPRRRGQNRDVDLVKIASWQVPAPIRISVKAYLHIKAAGMACHRSQIPLTATSNPISRAILRYLEGREYLAQLYPQPETRRATQISALAAPAISASASKRASATLAAVR